MLAWAKKEESGIGMIPLTLTGVPMITLIFGPLVQAFVTNLGPSAWFAIWAVTVTGLFIGFYAHHHQRAYTILHIHLLEQVEKEQPTPAPTPGTH